MNNPIVQARKDFQEGLGIDENPFPKDSKEWQEYRDEWNDRYLIEFNAEQEELSYGH